MSDIHWHDSIYINKIIFTTLYVCVCMFVERNLKATSAQIADGITEIKYGMNEKSQFLENFGKSHKK